MKCEFIYNDNGELKEFRFVPEKNEDEAELYRLSRLLAVKNPAVVFSENAKKGLYNAISDEDYEDMLKRVSLITYFCFDHSMEVNPVKLAAKLMELLMNKKYTGLTEDAYLYIEKEKERHAKEKEKKK